MADAPDDGDLRERIAELEATVEELQETTTKMLPSRRRVLQAGGLVAGGGLLGAAGSDQAAATDGTQDTSDGTVQGNGGGVDVRLDELRDPGGDEVFDVDDTGAINAAVSGREWRFDSIKTLEITIGGELDAETQGPTTVGTSDTEIFSSSGFNSNFLILVSNNTTSNELFSDVAHVTFGGLTVISRNSRSNAPSRSYSLAGTFNNAVNLELSLSSGSADVTAAPIGFL